MSAPEAIRQFLAMCGSEQINKGSSYVEPLRDESIPVSRVIGQCDYLATAVSCRLDALFCPFPLHSADAQCWAAGKLMERKWEREVVGALQQEARRRA